MKGTPGELHERPWVNFEHNRNEALMFAKGKSDYLLMIDADEIFEYEKGFTLPSLDKDYYSMTVRQLNAADVKRTALIKDRLDWKWEGILHELLVCPHAVTSEPLEKVINICNSGPLSGRSKVSTKEKYLRDAAVLEEALKKEPYNARYMCYLGQSYLAAEEYELAKKSYQARLKMASSDVQETFRVLCVLGNVHEKLGESDAALQAFFGAHHYRPTRMEPLFYAASVYRKQGNVLLGYLLCKYALTFSYPEGDVCVEYPVYDHQLLIEFANCALLLGKFDEGFDACTRLLANPHLPEEYKPSVIANKALAQKHLTP